MPSRKGLDQALTWLRSKMAEKDTLDAINAEVAYNVIIDLQMKRRVIGALYHVTNASNKRIKEKLEELELERLKQTATDLLTPVDFTEEQIHDIFGS